MEMDMGRDVSAGRSSGRRTVATFSTYAEAQRAVDYLSDRKFPVEHVAIVAEGLRIVEQVTGRLNYGRVALNGALSGAVIGGFFGFMFGLFDLITPLVSAFRLTLYGMLYGAGVGVLMSVIFYALTGGERDFTSAAGVVADRYNVMVDEDDTEDAARLLAAAPGISDVSKPRPGGEIPQPV